MKTDVKGKGLTFDEKGLIPAVVQDDATGDVLMVAWMNAEALKKTLSTGRTHFWSRSRKTLWRKGETSGHDQTVREVYYDCDGDTLLITVHQKGPACHTGRPSCFFHQMKGERRDRRTGPDTGPHAGPHILGKIYQVILDRKKNPKKGSYVSSLFAMGKDALLKKIPEEAGELVIGSKNNQRKNIVHEAADLLFHILVVLGHHGIAPGEVYGELAQRFGKPGRIRKKHGE